MINKKIFLTIVSLSVIILLFLQACTISTGLAANCVGVGDVVCDDTEAYQCQIAQFGTGYYVTRAPAFDAEKCGAVVAEEVDLSAYENILNDLDARIILINDDLREANNDYSHATTVADYLAIRRQLVTIQARIDVAQDELNMLSTDLSNAGIYDLDADVATMQTELDSAQARFDVFVGNVRIALAGLAPTGCTADSDCSGYTCVDSACLMACSFTSVISGCDEANGYTCDTSTDDSSTLEIEGTCIGPSTGGETGVVDTDGDGLTDADEVIYGTDPSLSDTDSDGYSDYDEVTLGTDPLDATEYPTDLCYDSDGGNDYENVGTVTGGSWESTGATYTYKEDSCDANGKLVEYYCSDTTHAYEQLIDCTLVNLYDPGYSCYEGACRTDAEIEAAEATTDSDGDGLVNSIETEIGFDLNVNELEDVIVLDFDADEFETGTYNDGEKLSKKDGDIMFDVTGTVEVIRQLLPTGLGAYLSLVGEDNYLKYNYSYHPEIELTDAVIIQAKVKPTNTTATQMIMVHNTKQSDNSANCALPQYGLKIRDGAYEGAVTVGASSKYTVSGGLPVINEWQEVTLVYDGVILTLFVDGVQVDEENVSGSLDSGAEQSLYIGADPLCTMFEYSGDIDSLQIWGE